MAAAHLLLLSVLFLGVYGQQVEMPTDILDVLERISDIGRRNWENIVCGKASLRFFPILRNFCHVRYRTFSSQEKRAFDELIEIATKTVYQDMDENEMEEKIKQVLRGEGHTFCERYYGFEEFCPIEPITSAPAVTTPNKELFDRVMRYCQLLEQQYGLLQHAYRRHSKKLFEKVKEVCKLVENLNPNALP
ncbi:hypothetical protein Q1695_015759 [Nippostrongylus brasiliensis]|nr:hypothetical protein Q1695_015759 [Nippostrongylus brasiliensis]